ncbi:hypothetical protein RM550_24805 [Streptomyces sp. DSM 41527]|uniref:Uncharacterized protein n=1 Tax=Streptomyces mooreae TaxID=3075523 RepID=A0ABU2TD63_9ACTN|nr:hypothetical protein [Streptomyces sp. DSM 41527]MDT0458902.1 hypothetical protein [Streptomyces sp. DSM 41527]
MAHFHSDRSADLHLTARKIRHFDNDLRKSPPSGSCRTRTG